MIKFEPHPIEQNKYLMIFKPSNFELTISKEEYQSIIDNVKSKIDTDSNKEDQKQLV